MAHESDVRLGQLTRFIFTAPSWKRSLVLILLLGFLIDGAGAKSWLNLNLSAPLAFTLPTVVSSYLFLPEKFVFSGTLVFTIPAIAALALTKPLIELGGKTMTWNRSGLLALACTVFEVIITLAALAGSVKLIPLFYAISLGFIFGLRLFVLVAIADYRVPRMILPALIQSGVGIIVGMLLFSPSFAIFALVLHLVFGLGFAILIWMIEQPLKRAFKIRGLAFINAFIAHLTDGGSQGMEDFFREIGEGIYVPQVSFFFSRGRARPVIFTVPNLHPGPMGEIGGGNLPKVLHDYFSPEETFVAHGCATHDFNLVSDTEIGKVISAMQKSRTGLAYTAAAGKSGRVTHGSVKVLYQRFGDSVLLVTSRSPERTEDLDFSIGMTIMAEGHRWFPHVAVVDAHNCMTDLSSPVLLATHTATEYLQAAIDAMEDCRSMRMYPFRIGAAHHPVSFSREQGFGDLGIQVMAVEVENQKTAYILIDGNNVAAGAREVLLEQALTLVDHAEIMTTDSHVVNTITGKNPVGMAVSARKIVPEMMQAIHDALQDLSPSETAAATAQCENVVVFGSNRIVQMASTVNAMLVFVAPLSLAMLLLAFLLSIIAYVVMA
jgi:putative membrane protein